MADRTRELRALTGLRGIAALSVALGHYGIGNLTDILKVFYWKNAAVDLFFCLSGFTLSVAYQAGNGRGLSPRAYLGARIARIYPLFVISLAGVILLRGSLPVLNPHQQDFEIRDFVQQILMINAWPVFGTGVHWNFPAWSVSVEFFCYLFVFPAAFYVSRPMSAMGWRARAALAVLLMAISLLLFLRYWGEGELILGLSRWPGTAFPPFRYFVPVMRGVLGMLAGWVIYFSYRSRDRFWQLATRWADVFVLTALAFLVCGALDLLSNQWMLPIFPAIILGLSSDSAVTSRLAASRPVHYLGVISYSIYLLHIPWRTAFSLATGLSASRLGHDPLLFALQVASLLIVSALSYRFVEMPLRGLVRRAFAAADHTDPMAPRIRLALAGLLVAFVLVQAQWAGLIGERLGPPVALGQDVARSPTFQQVAGEGWSDREDWGVWAIGHRSELVIPLMSGPGTKPKLALKGTVFVCDKHPAVTIHLTANGVPLETLTGTVANPSIDRLFDLPPAVFAANSRRLTLVITTDNPASPISLGLSGDARVIGFGLKSMMLVDGRGLP
jgi:peptidoglycan/LPS O-acetylase OafA/YrhL